MLILATAWRGSGRDSFLASRQRGSLTSGGALSHQVLLHLGGKLAMYCSSLDRPADPKIANRNSGVTAFAAMYPTDADRDRSIPAKVVAIDQEIVTANADCGCGNLSDTMMAPMVPAGV